MFVSKNEDKSLDIGQKQFKYNTGLEKTKLFVKGLPFSFEKDQVENIFKAVNNNLSNKLASIYKIYDFIWFIKGIN